MFKILLTKIIMYISLFFEKYTHKAIKVKSRICLCTGNGNSLDMDKYKNIQMISIYDQRFIIIIIFFLSLSKKRR